MNYKSLIFIPFAIATLSGCETMKQPPFDPGVDARIGAEVNEACLTSSNSSSGGYIRVGGRDGFLYGDMRKDYLLVFSKGCADVRFGGAAPVFRNYGGDTCRRKGEPVTTANVSGISGGCSIQHIYEWNEDAGKDEDGDA